MKRGPLPTSQTLANRFEQILKATPEEGARLVETWQAERKAADARKAAQSSSAPPDRSSPGEPDFS